MKNRLKSLPVKPRYLIAGLIAIELASLPAAAQVLQTVSFEVKPHVAVSQILDGEPGVSRFLVSSNAPFSVTAQGMVGELNVRVTETGEIGPQSFGERAQTPGPVSDCAMLADPQTQTVYAASRKTARERGSAVEQAVIIAFHYDAHAEPAFNFIPVKGQVTADPCNADVA